MSECDEEQNESNLLERDPSKDNNNTELTAEVVMLRDYLARDDKIYEEISKNTINHNTRMWVEKHRMAERAEVDTDNISNKSINWKESEENKEKRQETNEEKINDDLSLTWRKSRILFRMKDYIKKSSVKNIMKLLKFRIRQDFKNRWENILQQNQDQMVKWLFEYRKNCSRKKPIQKISKWKKRNIFVTKMLMKKLDE